MRRDGEGDEKMALDVEVQGRRRKGRHPKARRKDYTAADMRKKSLSTNMTRDIEDGKKAL